MTVCTLVVAAYNIEYYLSRCLDSLLAQSVGDIEVVVVDDGSTDGTGDIAERYARQDSRVTVVHRPNGGLSAARNSGLKVATGRYVAFVDGDDWVDPAWVEVTSSAAIETGADVVIAGCMVDTHDSQDRLMLRSIQLPPSAVLETTRPLRSDEVADPLINLLGYAWNKLYRRALLIEEGLHFEEGLSLVEDIVFNAEVLTRANRVTLVPEAFVHYVQRPRVTLGTKAYPDFLALRLRAIRGQQRILSHWGVSPNQLDAHGGRMARAALVSAVRAAASQKLSPKEQRALLELMLRGADEIMTLGTSEPAPRVHDRVVIGLVRRSHHNLALRGASTLQFAREIRRRVMTRSGTTGR